MNRSVVLIMAFAIASVPAFAQIGAKAQQGKIQGVWTNSDFGYQMTLMLNTDGSGEFDGEIIAYSLQGTRLTVKQQGQTTVYDVVLSVNTLRVSGGDLEQAITFQRQGSSGSTSTTSAATTTTAGNVPKNLLGIWSGYGETLEFKSNSECVYRGQTFSYGMAGNQITLETGQGSIPMQYAISGNQLTIVLNGQTFLYTKGASSASGHSQSKTANGKADQALVGQWCYVNVYSSNSGGSSSTECITLKADGTYEYYSESSRSVNTNTVVGGTSSQGSDRGTWSVQGDRIYYNSQSQGSGSYQLVKKNHPKTNDPMIVLDGRTYVTQTIKSPW